MLCWRIRRVWRYQRVIRSRKSKKDIQQNGQKKKDKRTNYDLQNNTQKNKYRVERTPLTTEVNSGAPERNFLQTIPQWIIFLFDVWRDTAKLFKVSTD
jgi:hypothetical protein